jgi:hypothetical protein
MSGMYMQQSQYTVILTCVILTYACMPSFFAAIMYSTIKMFIIFSENM